MCTHHGKHYKNMSALICAVSLEGMWMRVAVSGPHRMCCARHQQTPILLSGLYCNLSITPLPTPHFYWTLSPLFTVTKSINKKARARLFFSFILHSWHQKSSRPMWRQGSGQKPEQGWDGKGPSGNHDVIISEVRPSSTFTGTVQTPVVSTHTH